MPRSVLERMKVDHVLPAGAIAAVLAELVSPYDPDESADEESEEQLVRGRNVAESR